MNWIVYALVTMVLWGAWGTLCTVSLRNSNGVQASLIFGLVTVIGCAQLFGALKYAGSWNPANHGAAAVPGGPMVFAGFVGGM